MFKHTFPSNHDSDKKLAKERKSVSSSNAPELACADGGVSSSKRLNLKAVYPPLIEQAIRGFEEGDVGAFLISSGHQGGQLALVADNFPLLKRRGIFEKCLLSAFTCTRTNLHRWPPIVLQTLFAHADRQKLRAAGEPIPDEPRFRVYRGIAGDRYRRPRGYSWTLSLDVGCWFATRFKLANPCVLVAEVNNDEILAFVGHRDEQEVILRPTKYQNLRLTLAEIEEGAQRQARRFEGKKAEFWSKIREANSAKRDIEGRNGRGF